MPEHAKQAKAEVAKVEDYDSDESNVVAGTAKHASQVGSQPSSSKTQSHHQARKSHRDAQPDSGYSARTSKDPANTTSSRPAVRRTSTTTSANPATSNQSATRTKTSKPVIHRNDSGRTSIPSDQAFKATLKHTSCTDPYCRDPDCEKTRKQERRKTIVHQPPPSQHHPQTQQYPVLHQQYQPPQYQYAAPHDPNIMAPPMRPHAGSVSRPRPVSMHGYGIPSIPVHAPQPSATYYSGYPQPQMYGSQAPTANMGALYQPAPPMVPSPTSPTYPSYASPIANPGTYSARQVNAAVTGPGLAPLPGARQHVSARRSEDRPEQYSSESESISESSYSSEEDDRRVQRRRSHRRHPSEKAVAIIPHPSRPTAKHYHTEKHTLPTRSRRESRPQQPLQRSGRSDGDVYYSSDVGDSDRTARAVVARGYTTPSSRRPSVATTSSSGRTRATTLSSSNTDYSSHARMIVEGKHGRRSVYLPKEQVAELRRQQRLRDEEEEQLRLQENIEKYQRGLQGNVDPHELTAENMRKKDESRRRSASYVSNSRSHRSSGSQGGAGIKIQSGDTVLHVIGDARIEMRAGENGEPASFVVGGGGGGGGSRSSRSGRGRSDVRKRTIREENSFDDGYEVGRCNDQ